MIIACAGSGKTEVISRRIALMVSEGVPRDAIVAFTFTERAAGELKARIRRHLGGLRDDGVVGDAALGSMYVGTIHGFCLQLLRQMDPLYRNYEILDDIRHAAFITTNYHDSNGRGLGLNRLQEKKSRIKTIQAFIDTLGTMYVENIPVKTIRNPVLRDVLNRYHRLTRQSPNYLFNFNSIIQETIAVLEENSNLRQQIQLKFQHVVVDEYQDVDPRQERLIRLLSNDGNGADVCVVGDDDQAIYAWRGAEIQNILEFESRYPGVKRVELMDNFRSTHGIVEIANRAVRGDTARGRKVPGLLRRLDKNMRARSFDENSGGFVETMGQRGDIHRLKFGSGEEEAAGVADEIERMRGVAITDRDGDRGLDYGDIAVLYRSVRTGAGALIEEFDKRGIPYIVRGTKGLFDHAEVQLFQAAFCLLGKMDFLLPGKQHKKEEKEGRLGEAETRKFIRRQVGKLREGGKMPGANPAAFLEWLAATRRDLESARLPRDKRPHGISRRIRLQDLFHQMLENLGANAGPEPWPDTVMYNLGRFSDLLTQFESVHQWVTPGDLWDLNYFLGIWASRSTDEGGLDDPNVQNAVQILTVHQAKGLEWPLVFLPGLTGRRFPSQRRYGGREVLLEDDEYKGRRGLESGNPLRGRRDDEERRLWYVALTRCRKYLKLSCIERKGTRPSPFFKEIRHDYVLDTNEDPSGPRARKDPAPPSDTELLPTTYSDLNYYWSCPHDYKLRRLMGFSPGVREDYGYGQQVHNLLAVIHARAAEGKVDPEWVAETVQELFNLRYTTGEPLKRMRDAAERALTRYVREFPDIHHYVYEAEKPFEFVMGDAMVSGAIDLLNRLNDSGGKSRVPVEVVDFKTTRTGEDIPAKERLEGVTRQLVLYAIAAEDALGYDAGKASAHFLYADRSHVRAEIDISKGPRDAVRRVVADAVDGIRNGRFPMSGALSGRCKDCDYRRLCPGAASAKGSL